GFSTPALGEDQFSPVVVLNVEGDAPEEIQQKLAESVSAAIRTSVLTVYSQEIYGTGKSFKPRKHKSGPIGIAGRVFKELDRELEALVAREIGPALRQIPSGETVTYTVDIMWAKKPFQFRGNESRLSGSNMFGMLWSLVQRAMNNNENA